MVRSSCMLVWIIEVGTQAHPALCGPGDEYVHVCGAVALLELVQLFAARIGVCVENVEGAPPSCWLHYGRLDEGQFCALALVFRAVDFVTNTATEGMIGEGRHWCTCGGFEDAVEGVFSRLALYLKVL